MTTSGAHRHAVGLVRGRGGGGDGPRWVCERELREGLGGWPLDLPDAFGANVVYGTGRYDPDDDENVTGPEADSP